MVATHLKWRLFESTAAPIPRPPHTSIKLILVEHIWPWGWDEQRATFLRNCFQSILQGFPQAFFIGVGRRDEIQATSRELIVGRRRSHWLRPVAPHYVPLNQDHADPIGTPINGSDDSMAFVVSPNVPECTVYVSNVLVAPLTWQNLMVHTVSAEERLDVVDVVRRVVQNWGSVIQCACFTAESTRSICWHLRRSGALSEMMPPPPNRPVPMPMPMSMLQDEPN